MNNTIMMLAEAIKTAMAEKHFITIPALSGRDFKLLMEAMK